MLKNYQILRNSKITIFTSILLNLLTFIVIFIISINKSLYSSMSFEEIGILAIIIYIFIILSYFIIEREINFYIIFIVFSFFFYFGQHSILLFGGNFNNISRSILGERIPVHLLNYTAIFIIQSILLVNLGYLISNINTNISINTRKININSSFYSKYRFRKVGLVFLFISIIPSLIILTNNIILTFKYGYSMIFQSDYYTKGGFDNIIRFLSLIIVPSLLILLITYKGTKKHKYIVIIFFIWVILYLLSGSRFSVVLMVPILILIRHLWFKPINKKEIIKYILLLLILMIIFATISEIRNSIHTTYNVFELIETSIKNIIINNLLFAILEETGFTFMSIATVITYCPSFVPYNLGMSYFNSVFAIIPNLFWDIHPASTNTDIIFKNFFTSYGGIGSSFIGEAYYNFGKFSLFLMIIFGWLLGYLCKETKKAVLLNSYTLFYLCMYVSLITLAFIRSDTITFWRNFIYYGISPVIISKIILSKKCFHFNKDNRKNILS